MFDCFDDGDCSNLNGGRSEAVRLTEDTTTTITITTSPTVVLTANTNRKLLKVYLVSVSTSNAEVWIRYGAGATLTNSAHVLPLRHLLVVDSGQAANTISAICSTGTAQLRVSAANTL